MRIVHLSDIHYSPSNKSTFTKAILDPLISDLERFDKIEKIDLICFTGDLLDKGGYSGGINKSTEEVFLEFQIDVIEPIIKKLSLSKEKFLFIPGNHDINRTKILKVMENGLSTTLDTVENIENYMIHNQKELNLERISEYKEFEEYYYSDFDGYCSNPFGYTILLQINDIKIGIGGINSSWRCSEDDENKIIVGKYQLDLIKENLSNKEIDLKVALMHHPFEFISNLEKDQIKQDMISEFDIIMVGHTHSSSTDSTTLSIGDTCIITKSPSNWTQNMMMEETINRNGYSIIDYNASNSEIIFNFRRYNYEKRMFVGNTDQGQGDSDRSTFTLDYEAKGKWAEQQPVLDHIKEFDDSLEKSLISYKTDTQSPKELEDIFVWPNIIIKNGEEILDNEGNIINSEEENISISELCNLSESIILFGPKEVGKTAVLYRVFREFFRENVIYKQIPIYLDYNNIKEGKLEESISAFIGKTKTAAKLYLKENKIVLLIDNIAFDDSMESTKKNKELEKLVREYSDIKFIGTAASLSESEKSIKFLDSSLNKYKTANIQYFKTNEIKSLMGNWLHNSQDKNKTDLDSLVKNFHNLNIPTTPLSVSLFLWIYEKQIDFKPINNASLVNNFIEKLFEKHSDDHKDIGDFDYRNKENILAEVAYEMLQLHDINYRLEKSALIGIIKNALERKKTFYKQQKPKQHFSEWIVDYFEEKGILITENDGINCYYKFKLSCFFSYFLAQYISMDKSFKDRVFTFPDYLLYEEEIDYYTGLNRHDDQSLKFLNTSMNTLFKQIDILENIDSDYIPFDKYFNIHQKEYSVENDLRIDNLNEESLEKLLIDTKESEEDKTRRRDKLISKVNSDEKQGYLPLKLNNVFDLPNIEILQKSWILTAKVLKNLDNMDDGELKSRVFKNTVDKSLITMAIMKSQFDNLLQNTTASEELSKETKEFFEFFSRFSLVLQEELFYSVSGTSKLNSVTIEYIIELFEMENNDNDVLKFFSLFYYIDSKGLDYKKYFSEAIIKNISSSVKDFVFMKLTMLHGKSSDKSEELYFRDKLNDIVKKNNSGVIRKVSALSSNQKKLDRQELLTKFKEHEITRK